VDDDAQKRVGPDAAVFLGKTGTQNPDVGSLVVEVPWKLLSLIPLVHKRRDLLGHKPIQYIAKFQMLVGIERGGGHPYSLPDPAVASGIDWTNFLVALGSAICEPAFKFWRRRADRAKVTAVPAIVESRRTVSDAGSKAGPAGVALKVLTVLNLILLLLMGLGVAAKWQAGPPKGDSVIDFTTYYSGGRMAGVDRGANLYDLVAQAKDQTALAGVPYNPAAKKLQVIGFVNPPTSALLLRPLSLLPLTTAYRVWMLLEVALLGAAGWLVLQVAKTNRLVAHRTGALDSVFPTLAMAAAFPVGAALLQGSLTPVVGLGFVLFAKGVVGTRMSDSEAPRSKEAQDAALVAEGGMSSTGDLLRPGPNGGIEGRSEGPMVDRPSKSDVLIALGLLLIGMKPQYVLLPLAVLLGLRRFRALGFTALGQAMLMALSTLIVRPAAWIEYLKLLGTYNREIDTYGSSTSAMINVRGILASWLGASHASIINTISSAVLIIAVLGVGFLAHRSRRSHQANTPLHRTQLLIAMLLAGLIASPHAHSHDWTLALVALALAWFLPAMSPAKRCALALVPLLSFVTMSGVGSALGKVPIVFAAGCVLSILAKINAKAIPVRTS
jgi:hypothetical protein